MTLISLGKYTHHVAAPTLEKFSEVQLDVLWYLMNLTDIHRIHSKEAFREFLIRYLLIVDKPLDEKALDFIDHGILIDGVFENNYFSLSTKNLIELIGFASSNSKYNVHGSLSDFVNKFSYKKPKMVLEKEGDEKPKFNISSDMLAYVLMGIKTICLIDYLHLTFRENLKDLSPEYIASVEKFVDFVMENIPTATFENIVKEHPDLLDFRERHVKSENIYFDPYSLPQETLRSILEMIVDERELEYLAAEPVINEEMVEEYGYKWYMSHIVFAAGVKWGLIELSNHPFSLHFGVDPLFQISYDDLLGPDCELYATQEIYDWWKMKDWEHLLPEKN